MLAVISDNTYVVEDDKLVGPSTLVRADGVENAIVVDLRDELLQEEKQQSSGDGGKVKVVDHEWAVQLEGWAVAHELAASKDNNVV